MNTAIIPFSFEGTQVRTVTIEGEPHFVLADICKTLELTNPSMVANGLDSDDLSTTEVIDSMGRTQTARIVNESGLYDVAFMSRKPQARDFKRWVTKEVLPSIRKTGTYTSQPLSELEVAERYVLALRDKQALEAKIAADAPLVAHAQLSRQAEGLRTVGDLTNDLKVHAKANYPGVKILQDDLFDLAGRLGLLIRGNSVRNNQPTARAIEAGWVTPKDTLVNTKNHGSFVKTGTRLTPRGYARLWDAAVKNLMTHNVVLPAKELAA